MTLKHDLKVPMTRKFFLHKYLAYHMYKPTPIEGKFQKTENSVFSGPQVLFFVLKVSRGLVTN